MSSTSEDRWRRSHAPVERVVLAPDSFKGSASAATVASALARGIRSVTPRAEVLERPVADGGEGTVESALSAGFDPVEVTVTGPVGEPVRARYAVRGGLAVIELAAAAGLGCLPGSGPTRHTARTATTRGVGELVSHALDRGAASVLLGVGGSATTDGGSGAVVALGARVLDDRGVPLGDGGAALLRAGALDLGGLDPRLRDLDLTVACDVDNPLTGPEGAAAVYGPQKGAADEDVVLLDAALARWADVVAAATGRNVRAVPGAGAAGGMGFAAVALLGARLRPGIEAVLDLTGLRDDLRPGTLVVVGEGSLDAQTLRGKGPLGVATAARDVGAVVVAVVGRSSLSREQAREAGLATVYTLTELEPDPARTMGEAGRLLQQVGVRLAGDWLAPPN